MIKTLLGPVFRKYLRIIIAMTVVTALAIGIYTGLSGSYVSFDKSINAYLDSYSYADVVLITNPTAANIKSKLEGIEGVTQVNQRMIYDASVRLPNTRMVSARFYYYQPDNFLDMYVWKEGKTDGEFNVSVEKKFADNNNLSVGDYIEVILNGKTQKVCIEKLVSAPECISNVKDEYSLGESADFGVIFVSSENNFFGEIYNKLANQFLLRTDSSSDNENILKQAEEILSKRTTIQNSFIYENSGVSSRIKSNVRMIEVLSTVAPLFFYITMICVCALFMVQIVRQSRRDIGILKSQGFANSQIRFFFCILSLTVGIIGTALGLVLGLGINKFVNYEFLKYLYVPVSVFGINKRITLISVIITPAAGLLSTLTASSLIARIHPSEAMARDITTTVKVPGGLKNASPNFKLAVFSMFRNAKGFIFSVICITATITIIISSFEYDVSKDVFVENLYERRMNFDCQAVFTKQLSEDDLNVIKNIPGVSETEVFKIYSANMKYGDYEEKVKVHALDSDSHMWVIPGNHYTEIFNVPENGIILDAKHASDMNAAVGSKVLVNDVEFTVQGVSDQEIKFTLYIGSEESEKLGEPDRWGLDLKCSSAEDNEIIDKLRTVNGFSSVSFKNLLKQNELDTLKNHTMIVWICISCAMLMGYLIVKNTTRTNLNEMKKEISVLRSLGFQVNDISKIWFIQTMCQFSISLLLGLPAGAKIAHYVLDKVTGSDYLYPFISSPILYVQTALIVFTYILISHVSAMNSVKAWNIAENVKEKE